MSFLPRRMRLLAALAALAGWAPEGAAAQIRGGPVVDRPGDFRPELPPPEEPPPAPPVLPPAPEPLPSESPATGVRIAVQGFRVVGSTVFSDEALAEVTAPYVGRPISSADLDALRQRLTALYVDEGYINSAAWIPDQELRDDAIVEVRILEGELEHIEVETERDGYEGRFRERYLRSRLERGGRAPLNVHRLERALQVLQRDPRVRRVDAELVPGSRPGTAVLHVRFEEASPFHLLASFDNLEPPSVGSYTGRLFSSYENLTGWGDVLAAQGSVAEGLWDLHAYYDVPINRFDTTLGARFLYSDSEVVEEPFRSLDIEARSRTIGLRLGQPVWRTQRNTVELSLIGEHRESTTYLDGERFSFIPGPENGRATVSVLRVVQDWTYRDVDQLLAARSTFSFGLDVLGATRHTDNAPDGRYFAWLGQLQWLGIGPWGVQALVRADAQLSNDPLLSLEQYAVGGYYTVRGYPENALVSDDAVVASVELRIPLWSDPAGDYALQLAPFFDWGRSWNTRDAGRPDLDPHTLYSAGIGLRALVTRYASIDFYWGHAFRDVPHVGEYDLQDDGIHFRVTVGR